jgi:hypothetical protein
MARRRGWKRGDWLVRDEESGFTEYASNMRRDYYGVLKRKDQNDYAHPQDFIRAKNDPYINEPLNNPLLVYDTSAYNLGDFVGVTTVPSPVGPATHIYNPNYFSQSDPGLGDMEIGTSFQVR